MSKSRGTFVRRGVPGTPARALRYYFAAKLASGIETSTSISTISWPAPIRIWWQALERRERCAGFVERAGGRLAPALEMKRCIGNSSRSGAIGALFEARDMRAIREIHGAADHANATSISTSLALAKDAARAPEVLAVQRRG